ncbi:PEP/pyruvate-binding domain-containing protein [Niveibacterium sp.]|uniref:PEP/pyruvate-binding domain-containing protein n=1 Tax=Niveibacterium sp. TaxID=2017444 RepID=UPI0035B2667C
MCSLIRWFALGVLLAVASGASAQLASKPSAYHPHGETDARPAVPETYRRALNSRAEFDRLSRIYDAGTPLAQPHLLFVIDRAQHGSLYFINTRRFALHQDFLRDGPLKLALDRAALASNYRSPERRFIFGTVAWQAASAQWTFECWEGDRLNAALLREADAALRPAFFAPLLFKANALAHEQAARDAQLPYVTQEALIREQAFLPLNSGVAIGRIRVVPAGGVVADLGPRDIAVLDEVPISLPPVAGVVTTRPSTAISHVNLLAKGWGIPNAWVRDALAVFGPLDGQWVKLQVRRDGYGWEASAPQSMSLPKALHRLPQPDLTRTALQPLAALRRADRGHCGAKAANLGELRAAGLPGVTVPDGFCIPFADYAAFMQRDDVRAAVARAFEAPSFERDPVARHQALSALQAELIQLPLAPDRVADWRAHWQRLGGGGVFVRSSSNSEDLPGFSGAGLYTTVPNVTQADALAIAVKTVWASVFNAEAYEARRAAALPFQAVAMAVLVQRAVDPRAAGVMITRDPFDAAHRNASFIAAKRGVGIKVVEGRRVAEQVMVDTRSGAVQRLTEADEASALHLAAAGGVHEQALAADEAGTGILDTATALRIAHAGSAIRALFKGQEQDIEWALSADGALSILQARPYGSAPVRAAR